MNKQECIKQLEDLKQHQLQDNDPIWDDDKQALDMAIEELKKTAPEVPVQEQLFNINKRVKSIQWCLTIFSTTIIIMLTNMLFN